MVKKMKVGGFDSPPITNPTGAGLIAPIIYLIFYQNGKTNFFYNKSELARFI
jgi:hypothetical protein